ncbi:TrmB family transcriptional regulator [Methanobacterium sp. CWC-01]|uniref:TrmB family transcriptional regulator n=1 Tax=Methanobacterium aridiramus TaxID=2584467 RepID=UPI00257783C4|nr:helix-turn-helix domain-containing protein [Methanobacterium sp. CWC-01]WJI08949.1 TrmB family transcriptional regulator [Methanobacterium sp. CWC-01]
MNLARETIHALQTMGLTDYETRTYIALNSIISGTATEISLAANVPRSRIYQVLKSLNKKGFIETSRGKPLKFTVIPPRDVFRISRSQIKESMDLAETELNTLYESKIPQVPAPIWLIHGPDKVVNKELEIISRAKESLFVMGGFMFPGETLRLKNVMGKVIKKGVTTRLVTTPECEVDGTKVPVVDELKDIGAELKVFKIPYLKLVVRDKKEMLIAFCKFRGESVVSESAIAIWNQYPEFVETISGIYDFIWNMELFNQGSIQI